LNSPSRHDRLWSWVAIVAVVFLVAAYYLWELRAAGFRFDWALQQNGYYNYLARGFASGHLYVPIEPSAQLLASPNPWDPYIPDEYKMHDMSYYQGHYYLYHGVGPAVLLFAPYRLLTGHDLPERFAVFVFCFGGFLFSCGALIRLLDLAAVCPRPALLAAMLLALGVCQCVPFLLVRVWVYEVAIAGGYFCLSAAIFCLARGIEPVHRGPWLAAAGIMFGIAISCRPHLGIAGVCALMGLVLYRATRSKWRTAVRSRDVLAFAIGFAAMGAAAAAYNYARFGNPFEFGLRYLLAAPNQNRIKLSIDYLVPGLYYWLACAPEITAVFPWIHLTVRPPFNSPSYFFPPEYFLEYTVGSLFLAPFLPAVLLLPFILRRSESGERPRLNAALTVLWTVLIAATLVLLFLAASGFTTQRYEVDFLPELVLVALATFGIATARLARAWRLAVTTVFAIAIACGVLVNAALGLQGPFDEIRKNRPFSFARLASWFHPAEEHRPLAFPAFDVSFTAEFRQQADGISEPLVTIGTPTSACYVLVEHTGGKLRLISLSEKGRAEHDLEGADAVRARVQVVYSPHTGMITTSVNGRELVSNDAGIMVIAPSEITIGENDVRFSATMPRFTGGIRDANKIVRPDGTVPPQHISELH
jgi:hypothetical protein